MLFIKNYIDPLTLPLSNKNTLLENIEILAEEFGSGMDYGYEILLNKTPDKWGFHIVTLQCPEGAVASLRFRYCPYTLTTLFEGYSVNGVDFYLDRHIIEEYAHELVNPFPNPRSQRKDK